MIRDTIEDRISNYNSTMDRATQTKFKNVRHSSICHFSVPSPGNSPICFPDKRGSSSYNLAGGINEATAKVAPYSPAPSFSRYLNLHPSSTSLPQTNQEDCCAVLVRPSYFTLACGCRTLAGHEGSNPCSYALFNENFTSCQVKKKQFFPGNVGLSKRDKNTKKTSRQTSSVPDYSASYSLPISCDQALEYGIIT
ncbi:hypothetical protein Y032_0156g3146 [Ancylostoma ceylanicum]|uniref:Uncharacterized protein n=1 Tax=Ancylostoma ceylanicum TaxID=53326 RepID=A0A016SZA6_9BILA|nr:hypothetical protein Y032_0156g3146 [Ancylostoma ceylanicum]